MIPNAKRDGNLISRLLPVVIAGADLSLDNKSRLYIRLLARLVDKAFSEYQSARDLMLNEIKSNDLLAYRFQTINHLENCVNSIGRASKIFHRVEKGIDGKILTLDISKLIKQPDLSKIKGQKVNSIRNRIEHIDEDIYSDKFKKGLFLDVDQGYKYISINKRKISLEDLSTLIENFHKLTLEMLLNIHTY